jgi:hypothetical protein
MAVSTCPGGDLSVPIWGPGSGAEPRCHPVQLEVFDVDPALLEAWTPPSPTSYSGMQGCRHGLRSPDGVPPPLTEAVPVD